MLIILLTVVSTLCAVLGVYIAWRQHVANRKDKEHASDVKSLEQTMDGKLSPLVVRLTMLETKDANLPDKIEASVARALQPLQQAIMEQLLNVLHHPEPGRAVLDGIIDKLRANQTLSTEEETRLKEDLIKIVHWEPGQDVGFPVIPGEQTAAGLMLALRYGINEHV